MNEKRPHGSNVQEQAVHRSRNANDHRAHFSRIKEAQIKMMRCLRHFAPQNILWNNINSCWYGCRIKDTHTQGERSVNIFNFLLQSFRCCFKLKSKIHIPFGDFPPRKLKEPGKYVCMTMYVECICIYMHYIHIWVTEEDTPQQVSRSEVITGKLDWWRGRQVFHFTLDHSVSQNR